MYPNMNNPNAGGGYPQQQNVGGYPATNQPQPMGFNVYDNQQMPYPGGMPQPYPPVGQQPPYPTSGGGQNVPYGQQLGFVVLSTDAFFIEALSQQPVGYQPYGQPSAASYGQSVCSLGQPGTGFLGQINTGSSYGQLGSGSYGQPGSGSYGQPGSGSYGQPDSGSYGQPGSGLYGQPDTGSYGQPGSKSYGQPGSGSYGQPTTGSYGQSNIGAYGTNNVPQQNQPNQYGGLPTSGYGGNPAQGVQNLSHNMGGGPMPSYKAPEVGAGSSFGTGFGYTTSTTQVGYQQQSSTQQTNYSPASSMAQYQGTVRQYPNFNASQDAEALKKAMRGFGCDDKTVMTVLCNRSNAQRQQIRQAFKTMYGKDLIAELISELKGNFEDLIVALLFTPAEFDARELDYAMRGLGTTESTLIEIMTTRTNAEIQALKQAYKMLYHTELEDALSGETSGHFRRMLVSLSVGGRDESNQVDRNRAVQQAKQLFEDGEKRWGTVESTFNSTMIMNNPAQLQAIFAEYQKLTGHDIEQAVRNEFSGDILDGMLALGFFIRIEPTFHNRNLNRINEVQLVNFHEVKIGKNRPAFFAEKAYLAMKGLGTDDRTLIRVIVSRCEKDTVQIKQEYQRLYKTTLENDISGDTSGKYKEGLLTLLRG